MRLISLQELRRTEVFCCLARDHDLPTNHDKVNRLLVIQAHAMILCAVEHGVTVAQIAQVLDLDLARIKGMVNLLDGIHSDAVELLNDRLIPAGGLRLFRQVEMVRRVIASDNCAGTYAQALVIGSQPEQQAGPKPLALVRGLSPEEAARMEQKLEGWLPLQGVDVHFFAEGLSDIAHLYYLREVTPRMQGVADFARR